MTVLHRLWPSLSTLPTPRAVRSEWSDLLGPEFPLVTSLFRPTDDVAPTLSRPDGRPPYEVIRHGPDDYVGVCRETGEQRPLAADDLRVHAFDLPQCLDRLREAFGINPHGPQSPARDGVHFLGMFSAYNRVRPAYFVLVTGRRPDDRAEVEAWVRDHVRTSAVLFVPTRADWPARTHEEWDRAGHELFALPGTIGVGPTGAWVATVRPREQTPVTEPIPLTKNQLDTLSAMKKAGVIDADHWLSAETITRKVAGPSASVETFRTVLKSLRKLGLVGVKDGRTGGYWLTPGGRERAAGL